MFKLYRSCCGSYSCKVWLGNSEDCYNAMSKAVNPYGDGLACDRIVKVFL